MSISLSAETAFDLLVIGGGINGAGIACDAAGRGLKVLLCESGDLAQATSSASSKLIHGGLRYLEQYEFGLVRAALKEREVLLAKAPHIVAPLRFMLPHADGMRPKWMLRAGLFLYDHLYKRQAIPGSGAVNFQRDATGEPLRDEFTTGFSYWDCWVDDARLVVLNAMAAADMGADIRTRTEVLDGKAVEDHWRVRLKAEDGRVDEIRAAAVINAGGPWADALRRQFGQAGGEAASKVRLVKGSHMVVPRIPGADAAYILQNHDGRVVFVLPYEDRFSLIGTTDTAFEGDPLDARLDAQEQEYLLKAVSRFFHTPPTAEDIVWSYAGVRPLFDSQESNPSKVTRDYRLERSGEGPMFVSVLGGKITTYRRLAEQAVDALRPRFPSLPGTWTASARLPGGELEGGSREGQVVALASRHAALDRGYLAALVGRHGSLAGDVLGDCKETADLGVNFGGGLYQREVDYMRAREWARTPDDILWRRSKAGLHMSADERTQFGETLLAAA